MPRQIRIEHPGAIYHVMNRGDRGQNICHDDVDRQDCAETKAERIIAEELKRGGWAAGDLEGHPKGDPVKLALATRLRRETTLSLEWIANRLQLGAWRRANARLHHWRQAHPGKGGAKPYDSLTP